MLEDLPLRWDIVNSEHILKHGVTIKEIEEAYIDKNRVVFPTYGERFACVGAISHGKLITIILARSYESYYVVTARPASRKEREQYDQR